MRSLHFTLFEAVKQISKCFQISKLKTFTSGCKELSNTRFTNCWMTLLPVSSPVPKVESFPDCGEPRNWFLKGPPSVSLSTVLRILCQNVLDERRIKFRQGMLENTTQCRRKSNIQNALEGGLAKQILLPDSPKLAQEQAKYHQRQ